MEILQFRFKQDMKITRLLKRTFILFLVFCNFSCDQISKSIVRKEVEHYEVISLVGSYLSLTKVENTGAFLSAGSSLPYFTRLILLFVVPAMFLMYGLYQIMVKRGIPSLIITGWCFVIGGGIGNLYDRIVHGSVTDFLHLNLGIIQTGIFNFADISIMAGMLMILSRFFFYPNGRIIQ